MLAHLELESQFGAGRSPLKSCKAVKLVLSFLRPKDPIGIGSKPGKDLFGSHPYLWERDPSLVVHLLTSSWGKYFLFLRSCRYWAAGLILALSYLILGCSSNPFLLRAQPICARKLA